MPELPECPECPVPSVFCQRSGLDVAELSHIKNSDSCRSTWSLAQHRPGSVCTGCVVALTGIVVAMARFGFWPDLGHRRCAARSATISGPPYPYEESTLKNEGSSTYCDIPGPPETSGEAYSIRCLVILVFAVGHQDY
jgi:hypothetical protein